MPTPSAIARILPALLMAATAVSVAACGGDPEPSGGPAGSPENPAIAQPAPGGGEPTERSRPRPETGRDPGYDAIVTRQRRRPRERFTPCNLVTRSQARAILGAAVLQPREAPQGPTCIYRTRASTQFVTLAVQPGEIRQLTRHLRRMQRFEIASRRAYCGTLGQPVLYVALGGRRVLSVSAPCDTARRFASTALSRLRR